MSHSKFRNLDLMWAIATNACMYRKALLDRRNTLRVEAVLLKSLNLYSTHACFNSRKICSNGDREGKENLLVTKVIGKGKKKVFKYRNTRKFKMKGKSLFFFFFSPLLNFLQVSELSWMQRPCIQWHSQFKG